MKYVMALLFPLLLWGNEQRVLLTGFSIHEHEKDRFNEVYNAFNYGGGYEYTFFNEYNEIYFAMNTLVFNDSFKNPQFVYGMGHSYRFNTEYVDIAIGINGFVGIKKIYTDEDLSRDNGHYGVMGGVGPAVNFYYDNFSVNFVYVPAFKYKDLETTGFLFTYFGYKF